MKLDRIGKNTTVVTRPDGFKVLFSYECAAAAYVPGRGYVRSNKYFSRSTLEHVREWLDGEVAEIVKHPAFLKIVGEDENRGNI